LWKHWKTWTPDVVYTTLRWTKYGWHSIQWGHEVLSMRTKFVTMLVVMLWFWWPTMPSFKQSVQGHNPDVGSYSLSEKWVWWMAQMYMFIGNFSRCGVVILPICPNEATIFNYVMVHWRRFALETTMLKVSRALKKLTLVYKTTSTYEFIDYMKPKLQHFVKHNFVTRWENKHFKNCIKSFLTHNGVHSWFHRELFVWNANWGLEYALAYISYINSSSHLFLPQPYTRSMWWRIPNFYKIPILHFWWPKTWVWICSTLLQIALVMHGGSWIYTTMALDVEWWLCNTI